MTNHPKIIKCSVCGREFMSRARNGKYCSLYCMDFAQKQKRSHWMKLHPEYYRDYMRQYRSKDISPVRNTEPH